MSILNIIQIFLFSCALSTDVFMSSFSYAVEGIKIRSNSAFVISGICALMVALGIKSGSFIFKFLPLPVVLWGSTVILILISLTKFFEFSIKRCIKKNNTKRDFYFLNFHFFLEIVCDTTKADVDKSKDLSVKEACVLSMVLSLDGFAAGIGAGLLGFKIGEIFVFTFMFGMIAVFMGSFFGERIAKKSRADLSWISGAMLLILAILKGAAALF